MAVSHLDLCAASSMRVLFWYEWQDMQMVFAEQSWRYSKACSENTKTLTQERYVGGIVWSFQSKMVICRSVCRSVTLFVVVSVSAVSSVPLFACTGLSCCCVADCSSRSGARGHSLWRLATTKLKFSVSSMWLCIFGSLRAVQVSATGKP